MVHNAVAHRHPVLLGSRRRKDLRAAQVGRHDDERVFEADRLALRVGDAPVVQDLQQHVEDVHVRLFNLIKEDDAVGAALDRVSQQAALIVADIAWGRADEPRHRMLLHVLRHVEAHNRILAVEQVGRKRLCQLRFADAGRTQEHEACQRAVRVDEISAAALDGLRHCVDSLLLPDDALVQLVSQMQELLALTGDQLCDGDASPAADHLGDVTLCHVNLGAAVLPERRKAHWASRLRTLLQLRHLLMQRLHTRPQLARLLHLALVVRLVRLARQRVNLPSHPHHAAHKVLRRRCGRLCTTRRVCRRVCHLLALVAQRRQLCLQICKRVRSSDLALGLWPD
mmetsp:Transcript_42787/g.128462  ORF Transcript_42787/g.128462 Transcript_42787/m.128462 type:complete len:340 (+) Transcript_42787:615-1634(+)